MSALLALLLIVVSVSLVNVIYRFAERGAVQKERAVQAHQRRITQSFDQVTRVLSAAEQQMEREARAKRSNDVFWKAW